MKKFLFTLLFALFAVPTTIFAAFNDVTLTTDAVINVASINLSISGSSAVVESIVVVASSFDVVLQSGSSITIASADRRTFTLSPSSGFTSSTGCDANQSTLTLSGTGSITVTITPTGTTCTIVSSGVGGSGSSYAPLPLPGNPALRINNGSATTSKQDVVLAISASNAAEMMLSNNSDFFGAVWELYATTKNWRLTGNSGTNTVYVKFRNLNNVISAASSQGIVFENPIYVTTTPAVTFPSTVSTTVTLPTTETTQTTYATPPTVFTKNLTSGNSGADVVLLQTFLEAGGFLVMPPGIQKGYFGRVTKNALIEYQKSAGLPATGYFGALTRAKINNGVSTVTETPRLLTVGVFTRDLRTGNSGDDVTMLQTFLEKGGFLIMPPGVQKGYFGQATKDALITYQVSIGIAGTGYLGPKTRTKLEEVFVQ